MSWLFSSNSMPEKSSGNNESDLGPKLTKHANHNIALKHSISLTLFMSSSPWLFFTYKNKCHFFLSKDVLYHLVLFIELSEYSFYLFLHSLRFIWRGYLLQKTIKDMENWSKTWRDSWKPSFSFETKCEQRNLVRNHSEVKNLQTVNFTQT